MPVRRAATVLCLMALCGVSLHSQSRVVELIDAGWKALHEGNGSRAAGLFADALALRPNDPVLLMGAGAAAHAQGKQQDAMAHLQQALTAKPDLTAASMLLGQIAFDEGDVDLAVRTYENALKYAPRNADLTRTLDEWRRDAGTHAHFDELRYEALRLLFEGHDEWRKEPRTHASFDEFRCERFRILFEGHDERSLAMDATRVFNSAFFRIAGRLGEYPPDTIVAVLYTEQQFRDVTRAPKWSGGAYDGRIRIPVAGAYAP